MRHERPVLTARWTDLLLLNFRVPRELLASLAPPGTEPDLHDGDAYLSVVGFRFQNTRLFGLPIPGHTRFVEINLRYYVRRQLRDSQWRRGVVFVKEIAPRRAIGAAANWLYNENYITRPMRSTIHIADSILSPGDTIEYAWQTRIFPLPFRKRQGEGSATAAHTNFWNRLAARIAAPLQLSTPGSFEEFIIDNYWGYVRGRNGRTREYRVMHDPWRVAPAADVVWDCDLAATYDPPFAEYLAAPPASALIAEGSPIELFRGCCI
jgi:uncharacterized protein YqjF (DUF2071 family)